MTVQISNDKLNRMLPRIQAMVELLEQHCDDSGPVTNFDLTEYRRHKAELLALQAQLQETLERLLSINTKIENCYPAIFRHWRNDVVAMNAYRALLSKPHINSSDCAVPQPL